VGAAIQSQRAALTDLPCDGCFCEAELAVSWLISAGRLTSSGQSTLCTARPCFGKPARFAKTASGGLLKLAQSSSSPKPFKAHGTVDSLEFGSSSLDLTRLARHKIGRAAIDDARLGYKPTIAHSAKVVEDRCANIETVKTGRREFKRYDHAMLEL